MHRRLEPLQSVPDGGQQLERLVGQLDPPAGASEQRHLYVRLERLDLLADGGGRHIERVGGGRKIQGGRDRLEHAQRTQRQPVVGGGRHVKFFLTRCQALDLLNRAAWAKVASVG